MQNAIYKYEMKWKYNALIQLKWKCEEDKNAIYVYD